MVKKDLIIIKKKSNKTKNKSKKGITIQPPKLPEFALSVIHEPVDRSLASAILNL